MDTNLKLAVLAILSITAAGVSARDRPIASCEKAPLLADFKKQLPSHIYQAEADIKPELQTSATAIPVASIVTRSGGSRVCVVVVLDAAGNVQDAAVSYPRSLGLNPKERERILALKYSPAEKDGHPVPSLASIDMKIE